jgi:hypothetical protein
MTEVTIFNLAIILKLADRKRTVSNSEDRSECFQFIIIPT